MLKVTVSCNRTTRKLAIYIYIIINKRIHNILKYVSDFFCSLKHTHTQKKKLVFFRVKNTLIVVLIRKNNNEHIRVYYQKVFRGFWDTSCYIIIWYVLLHKSWSHTSYYTYYIHIFTACAKGSRLIWQLSFLRSFCPLHQLDGIHPLYAKFRLALFSL